MRLALLPLHVVPRTGKIPYRLLLRIRHPHRRQIARTQMTRELLHVPPVCLDALSWLAGNQGRNHNLTIMSQGKELAIQPVAARTGFVAEQQDLASKLLMQTRHQLGNLSP